MLVKLIPGGKSIINIRFVEQQNDYNTFSVTPKENVENP